MSSNAPQIPVYWATSPGKAPQQPLPKEPESAEPSPAGLRHQASQSQPLVSNPAFIESEPIDISSAAPTRQSTVRRGPSNEIQRYYYVESEPGAPLRRSEDMPGPPRSIYAGENRRLYRDAYPDRDIWYDDDPRRPPRANGYRRRPIGIRPPPPPPSVAEPNLRVRRSYEAGPSPKRVVYSEDDGVYYYSDDDEASLKRGIDPQGEYYYHAGRGAGGGGGGGHGRGAGGGGMKDKPPSEVLRLPWTMWMNSNAKNHFVAAMGEFVGTTMFLFFAFAGTQVGATAGMKTMTVSAAAGKSPDVLLYISLIFAFSLMVNVWIFFRISGGLFNPAVTLAMLMTRTISAARAILLTVAQLAGSIFASFLVKVMFPQKLDVRTTLSDDTSIARGIFIEAVLTAELVFTIFMLAKEKHKATFIAPVGIGLALFIAELVGVYYTGGSLNPARSFGPCVVTGVFESEHWIYWLGPAIGALFALAFYKFIKILEYEMANPGQDADYHPPKTDVESQHKGGKQG